MTKFLSVLFALLFFAPNVNATITDKPLRLYVWGVAKDINGNLLPYTGINFTLVFHSDDLDKASDRTSIYRALQTDKFGQFKYVRDLDFPLDLTSDIQDLNRSLTIDGDFEIFAKDPDIIKKMETNEALMRENSGDAKLLLKRVNEELQEKLKVKKGSVELTGFNGNLKYWQVIELEDRYEIYINLSPTVDLENPSL